MPVKSTGPCQGWIKNIRQVCSSHQYDALQKNEIKSYSSMDKKSHICSQTFWCTSFCSKPSISTSSWCNVFFVWPSHCFLVDPTASISSIKMMQGACAGWGQDKYYNRTSMLSRNKFVYRVGFFEKRIPSPFEWLELSECRLKGNKPFSWLLEIMILHAAHQHQQTCQLKTQCESESPTIL